MTGTSDPAGNSARWNQHAVEQLVGRLLQGGVLIAAAVTIAGGVWLLAVHGGEKLSLGVFRGEPDYLRSIGGIVRGALEGRSDAIVQLGLVLLVATPVARVALTMVTFLLQRDRIYAAITALVFALLLYGLFFASA